ncbi:MAG: hypothetical protein ACREA0_28350 [bacterium]
MSVYTNDTILRRGILTEQTPFPAKPFTPTVLVQKVRHVPDKPTPPSAES